ncbi:hypothetical protein PENTCL1PPCAC_9090, partial [Pristionchus entomophagus]
EAAKQMQSKYTRDNGDTDYFVYESSERNDLAKLIRLRFYGFRREEIGYSIDETKAAIKIKKMIVQASGGLQSTVLMNTAYMSTITCEDGI